MCGSVRFLAGEYQESMALSFEGNTYIAMKSSEYWRCKTHGAFLKENYIYGVEVV